MLCTECTKLGQNVNATYKDPAARQPLADITNVLCWNHHNRALYEHNKFDCPACKQTIREYDRKGRRLPRSIRLNAPGKEVLDYLQLPMGSQLCRKCYANAHSNIRRGKVFHPSH